MGRSHARQTERYRQNVAELRSVEGMVDSQKQLDVLADLLKITGKAPAQGKDAVEDFADAPISVKSEFFRAVIWIRCGAQEEARGRCGSLAKGRGAAVRSTQGPELPGGQRAPRGSNLDY